MSAIQKKFDEGFLATILVAPIISEKATRIGEKLQEGFLAGSVETNKWLVDKQQIKWTNKAECNC